MNHATVSARRPRRQTGRYSGRRPFVRRHRVSMRRAWRELKVNRSPFMKRAPRGGTAQILAFDTFTPRDISGSYARLNPRLIWPAARVCGAPPAVWRCPAPAGNRYSSTRLCTALDTVAIPVFYGVRPRHRNRTGFPSRRETHCAGALAHAPTCPGGRPSLPESRSSAGRANSAAAMAPASTSAKDRPRLYSRAPRLSASDSPIP